MFSPASLDHLEYLLMKSYLANNGICSPSRPLNRLTGSIMHSSRPEAPTKLVVCLGHRTSDDAPEAVPLGQYDPTGHLFCTQVPRTCPMRRFQPE